MDVVAGEVVLAATRIARSVADRERVECRAEIDEERIVTLAGEHLAAVRQAPDRLVGEHVVVGHRLRPDVVRGHGQVACEHVVRHLVSVPVVLDRDHVGLVLVQVGRVDRVDRRGRIQERVGVPDVVLEREQEPNVGPAVAGVVDVQPVPRTLVELVEVRPSGRILERDPVGDHRQLFRAHPEL